MSVKYKRVAIFIDSLGGGGAERVMLNLAKGIIELGHGVHIFCLESRQDHQIPVSVLYDDRNLKKIARGRHIKKSAMRLKKMVSDIELEGGDFNLYLSNLDPTNAVVSRCGFRNTYYVLHSAMEHEIARERRLGPIKWYRKVKAKRIMNDKDLVAVSEGVANEAINLGVISPRSVTTIYNPLDIDNIKEMALSLEPNIPDEPYIIHVGRVVKAKRHDVLFDAVSRMPKVKLVLLCKDTEKVKAIAAEYGVADRIILPGFTNNPYAWMSKAKLCVLSSDYEGLSMVLLESLVCGVPVVSTNCNYGPSEILAGPLSEFLSPVGDAEALRKNIERALLDYPSINDVPILKEVGLKCAAEKYLELCD
jgi:glycosyltransferase involved in cell wall biosynthesis